MSKGKSQKLRKKPPQPALPPGEDILVFESIALQRKPVEIVGAKYVLLELDGLERDAYLTLVAKKSTTDSDGNSSITSFNNLQADLIHRSLFLVDENGEIVYEESGDKKRIPIPEIQSWPASMIQTLFEASQALSKLDLKDEDDEDDPKDEKGND